MIHHRPQDLADPLLQHANLMSSAALDNSMVLSLRLPFNRDNAVGSFAPSASIRIDSSGNVLLTMPCFKTEQDIHASTRKLIAARLEVSLNRVYLEPMSDEAAREMSSIDGSDMLRIALRLLAEAATTFRVMLITAAAGRWGVKVRSCHAHGGEVIHTPTWRKFRYGELVIDAACGPIPKWST